MKKIASIALASACALATPVVSGCEPVQELPGSACVSFIDVGKGDCILLQAGESAALIDTGYDATAGKVVSYLRNHGVEHLECVVITHYDRDHVEGVRGIGEQVEIGAIYLPGYEGSDKNYSALIEAVEELGLDAQSVSRELSLPLGDAVLRVFPSSVGYIPGVKGEEGNDNDVSLVASLTSGGDTYLFTGDLEKDGIESYLSAGHGHFDVLEMPHHGNKCSLTDELIADVRPQIAVITDSAGDPADKKTLKLLKEAGVNVYRTGADGTIVVQGDGAGRYSVSTRA